MLDFGWAEFLIIALIGVLIVGPRDIPRLMYQAGKIVRRMHYMKFALSQQFDDFMEKTEADIAKKSSNEAAVDKTPNTSSHDDEADLEMDESNPYFVTGDEEGDHDDLDQMVADDPDEDADAKADKKEEGHAAPSPREGSSS